MLLPAGRDGSQIGQGHHLEKSDFCSAESSHQNSAIFGREAWSELCCSHSPVFFLPGAGIVSLCSETCHRDFHCGKKGGGNCWKRKAGPAAEPCAWGKVVLELGIVVPLFPRPLVAAPAQLREPQLPRTGWASSECGRGFHLGGRKGSFNICWLPWSLIPFWNLFPVCDFSQSHQ